VRREVNQRDGHKQNASQNAGIKIVLDFIPNGVSIESDWFQLSEEKVKGYENYFVWRAPKNQPDCDPYDPQRCLPPNEWVKVAYS